MQIETWSAGRGRVLTAHVAHPNAGAVVLVRLGCEDNRDFVDMLRSDSRFASDFESGRIGVLTMQEIDQASGRTVLEEGKTLVRNAIDYAKGFRPRVLPRFGIDVGG